MKNQERKNVFEREYKDYKIHTEQLIREIRRNIRAGKDMIKYAHRYMEAALTLSMYDLGDLTFDMVENGREYYVNLTLLWLSKTVNCLMYFQSEAKKRGYRVFDGWVQRDEYCDCVDLVSSAYQALMEFFHDDYAEAQAKEIPVDLPKAA